MLFNVEGENGCPVIGEIGMFPKRLVVIGPSKMDLGRGVVHEEMEITRPCLVPFRDADGRFCGKL